MSHKTESKKEMKSLRKKAKRKVRRIKKKDKETDKAQPSTPREKAKNMQLAHVLHLVIMLVLTKQVHL